MILSMAYFSLIPSVYPTGTVDFMTMVALGLCSSTSSITDSTLLVSK